MKTLQAILLLTLMVATGARAQTSADEKPTLIFVHGIWADGSCYTSQIEALQAKGYHVVSVQNSVTSLADDVAATQRRLTKLRER